MVRGELVRAAGDVGVHKGCGEPRNLMEQLMFALLGDRMAFDNGEVCTDDDRAFRAELMPRHARCHDRIDPRHQLGSDPLFYRTVVSYIRWRELCTIFWCD